LLRRLKRAEQEEKTGQGLKIILGSAAGVGKTYHMLEGAVSPEGVRRCGGRGRRDSRRPETEALLEGLEVIPRRHIEHGGVILEELDRRCLQRHPAIALVDELAHTNAPGSRHDKRYKDVEELLEAGVDVYSTLNIQHIESLNDVVYQITGVKVRETLPDRIWSWQRRSKLWTCLQRHFCSDFGMKVYFPPKADQAMQRFFRKGNLLGLREMR